LPHAANRVHAVLGGDGVLMPLPRLVVVRDLDDDARSYPVITGEYSSTPSWESRPVVVGTPIAKPSGVFVKLDPEQVIEDERARLGDTAPGGTRHHTDPLAAPKMARPKGSGQPSAEPSAGAPGSDETPTA
jgi:methionyl-tRNA synthetase